MLDRGPESGAQKALRGRTAPAKTTGAKEHYAEGSGYADATPKNEYLGGVKSGLHGRYTDEVKKVRAAKKRGTR